MAPIFVHRYQPRSLNSGMTFTVIFATLAGVVIVCCLVWGFIFPYIRRKYLPPKPSQTRFNTPIPPRAPTLPLTNHPYRQREASTRRSAQIVLYDPRIQTPFLTAPTQSESINLPTVTPPRIVTPVANTSHSLFTPILQRDSLCPGQGISKSHTLPRVRSKTVLPVSTDHEKDFGDAKDYILALPEPLRFRSRTFESQMMISDSLRKLDDVDQMSTPIEKTLHPRKLFEQLKINNPRGSTCSSTSLKAKELPAISATNTANVGREERTMSKMLQQLAQQEGFQPCSANVEDTVDHAASDVDDEASDTSNDASRAMMHRLRTYRSLVGTLPPEPLSRAGTLTRPKTPVAIMRNKYDKVVNETNVTEKTVSHNDTISTLFRGFGDSSEMHSSPSSQTSPPKASTEEFEASSPSLLPTPLYVNQVRESRTVSSTSRRDSRFTEELDDVHSIDLQTNDKGYRKQVGGEDVSNETSEKLLTASRPRPAPLAFGAKVRHTPHQTGSHLKAHLANRDRARLRKRLQVSSIPASSVYSRDTQGFSVANTPITPDFPKALSCRPPFSPIHPSTIGGTADSDRGTEAILLKERGSPADTVKSKVENWRVDMENLSFNTSPSPSLKRAISTLGPVCNSTHGAQTEDVNRLSTISTELAPSEARLSSLVSPIRISDCTEVGAVTERRRDAPGGAYWL